MASSNYIMIPATASTPRLGMQVRFFVDQLQVMVDQGRKLSATMAQANSDGAANLATDLGLTSDQATAVYALIASVVTDLTGDAFISQLLARCG